MSQLNRKLLAELQTYISRETLSSWTRNFNTEQENENKKMNTPATNCTNTSWRKQGGNAIDKIKRKRRTNHQANSIAKEVVIPSSEEIKLDEEQNNSSNLFVEKTVIKNKAVFFGEDCELPYLHSSDAITHLYVKKSRQNENKQEVLYNPSGSLDRSYMTSLKCLHIYHTSIESLRQLGTGWCNLKELSILYGKLVDLSGLSSFSSLQYLFLAFNQITSLSDVMFHPSIKCLDLQRNRIENAEEIEYLATMDKLETINLNGNPVMKIKETRRIIQQKLGKKLESEDFTRLAEYQLEEMVRNYNAFSYEDLEVTNHLVKVCNESLLTDEISLENLYESYQLAQQQEEKQPLDFVRYEAKHSPEYFEDSNVEELLEPEEEIFFTPLIHFLNGKKHYTSIIKKYFENKIYLNMKKAQKSSQSPAHSSLSTIQSSQRLSKYSASVKHDNGSEDTYSLDKKECLTADLNSVEKAKRTRLSLGRTKKILQTFNKPSTLNSQMKFAHNFAATTTLSGAKTFTLKRSMIKKPSMSEMDGDYQKKFAKTSSLKHD